MPPKAVKKKEAIVITNPDLYPPVQFSFIVKNLFTTFEKFAFEEYVVEISHVEIPLTKKEIVIDESAAGDFVTVDKISPVANRDLPNEYICSIQPNDLIEFNKLCDCPLFIGLYGVDTVVPEEIVSTFSKLKSIGSIGKKSKKSTKNKSKETILSIVKKKTLLAYNGLDLMHLITKNAISEKNNLFLYWNPVEPNLKTPTVEVQIESKRALIKKQFDFTNVTIITLESIFNLYQAMSVMEITPNEYLLKSDFKIAVDFSLMKYENNEQIKEKLCTFRHFNVRKYNEFDSLKKWDYMPNFGGFGSRFKTISFKTNRSLNGEIYQNNVKLDLNKLNGEYQDHEVLMFNSIHRLLMTEEVCRNMENLILTQDVQIVIDIRLNDSDEIQFVGYADLSPILYPNKEQARFLVKLNKSDVTASKNVDNSKNKNTEQTTKTSGTETPKEKLDKKTKRKSVNSDKTSLISQSTDRTSKPPSEFNDPQFLIFEMEFHYPLSYIVKNPIDLTKFKMSKHEDSYEPPKPTLFEIAHHAKIEFENEILTIVKEIPKYLCGDTVNCEIICKDAESQECIKSMQCNLIEKIVRLISAKFNVDNQTKTNSEFRNLMTIVYNEIIVKVEKIISDHFMGIDNYANIIENQKRKNIKVFTEYECHEMMNETGFQLSLAKAGDSFDGDEKLDEIIFSLKRYDFFAVNQHLTRLLKYDHSAYYGLLVELYIIYLNSNYDDFISKLSSLSKTHPYNFEVWSLLYAIYKSADYRPGYKYSMMHSQLNFSPEKVPNFWQYRQIIIQQPTTIEECCCSLCACFYVFIIMGLYKFAELVYDKCKDDFSQPERTHIHFAIILLLKDYDRLKKELDRTTVDSINQMVVTLFWGHYYFAIGDKKLAKINYEIFYHTPNSNAYDHVAFLRCGILDNQIGNYENAETYFVTCANKTQSFVAWFGLGICLFRLNDFEGAKECFAKVTSFIEANLCETWLYLAMISVKQNDSNLARDFLSFARMNKIKNQFDTALWEETLSLFKANFIDID